MQHCNTNGPARCPDSRVCCTGLARYRRALTDPGFCKAGRRVTFCLHSPRQCLYYSKHRLSQISHCTHPSPAALAPADSAPLAPERPSPGSAYFPSLCQGPLL
ncbi:phosphoserine phosphatase [Platysternon megacephalum]|uniref:Phosphoserine phosphatase n=1 Tax=Platysternon megacephalum TaxID=55544 RepID=A0A4D9EXG9_9SAUR|nr:phosphoserine phosphatase [Platysternon megacephalum]